MLNATVAVPDLTTFCRLDGLGLIAVGQQISPGRAVIKCRVRESDRWCRSCDTEGVVRDTVVRKLAHEPFGHRPTILMVRVRRYRCEQCGCTWRQDTDAAAERRAKISRRGLRWALEAVVVDHLTVSRVAAGLGVSWHTANTAILTEGKRRLIDDPHRFEGHLDAVFAAEELMKAIMNAVTAGVPGAVIEIRRLGWTLKQRAADVLAFFDRPGTSNGPTEAFNGRLEHLRGSALGFRNLTDNIARSLLESGGFRPYLHSEMR